MWMEAARGDSNLRFSCSTFRRHNRINGHRCPAAKGEEAGLNFQSDVEKEVNFTKTGAFGRAEVRRLLTANVDKTSGDFRV